MDRAASIAERKRHIVAHLAQVEAQLAQLRGLRRGESDDDEHDPEGVSLSSEWSRLEGLKRARLRDLEEIRAVEERVAAGADGVCAVCGGPIGAERLAARPEATRCIRCAA